MSDHVIRVRSWVKASEQDVRTGLLGWISVEYGDVILDGMTLRRTSSGRLAISFPTRSAKNGEKHPIVRPVDDGARIAIEAELLWQLGEREDFVA